MAGLVIVWGYNLNYILGAKRIITVQIYAVAGDLYLDIFFIERGSKSN